MASPVPKFPFIIENLRDLGITKEVPFATLRKEVIRETGSIKDETIKHIVNIMVDLGYIERTKRPGIFEIVEFKEGEYD
jgi:hypothetical protein